MVTHFDYFFLFIFAFEEDRKCFWWEHHRFVCESAQNVMVCGDYERKEPKTIFSCSFSMDFKHPKMKEIATILILYINWIKLALTIKCHSKYEMIRVVRLFMDRISAIVANIYFDFFLCFVLFFIVLLCRKKTQKYSFHRFCSLSFYKIPKRFLNRKSFLIYHMFVSLVSSLIYSLLFFYISLLYFYLVEISEFFVFTNYGVWIPNSIFELEKKTSVKMISSLKC